jgi:UDP-glucose 4-epimerase
VCHLAAQASVTVSVREPELDLAVNVRGTFNVLEAARAHGAHVVFASTGGALYGDDAPLPSPESVSPQPLAPYGASKLAAEAYVATWGRLHDLPNVVLRLGNVYGPRQTPHGEAGVVAIFSDRLRREEAPVVYGNGLQTRDYIHVADVAAAFLAAAEGRRAATYNVGWGQERTVLELLAVLQRAAGTAIEPVFEPLRPGELMRSALDPTALRAAGWAPTIAFDEGVAETFATYA